jgi:xanthine dehydrogenase YagS FAD-binding subunit
MNAFSYAEGTTVDEVVAALRPDVRPIGGGVDLLHLMKAGLQAPESLVGLKSIPSLGFIGLAEDGVLIGATATLSQLANQERVPDVPGLACLRQAASRTASPQIRNMATLAGNLLQKPRCWYYRNPATHCWLKGGPRCFAVRGENKYHALFGRGACQAVHPSDPAVALGALGAEAHIVTPSGRRKLALLDLYQTPSRDSRSQDSLGPTELLASVLVPFQSESCQSAFVKVSERSAWDFALVSVAVVLEREDDLIRRAQVVLGGVAPGPWRMRPAESELEGAVLDDKTIARAADAATEGARPLEHNAYKVDLIRGAVRQALRGLR